MWRGCVDVIGLTNLCQMDVDIIVYIEGKNPEVKHFSPDPDFPWKENDDQKPLKPNVRAHPKMTVLNYKDQHFNLVVEKESMIAQSGTFSHQRKVSEETKPTSNITPNQHITNLELKIQTLERKLEESMAENKCLIEGHPLKETETNMTKETEESNVKCTKSEKIFKDKETLKSHMNTNHYSFKLNCYTCGKGFNEKKNLFDHKKIHEEELNPESKCMLCEINFNNNKSLNDHIMQQHPKKDQLNYKCRS